MMGDIQLPAEQPLLRVTTMPNDANEKGDIFGGWLMSQLDIAGAVLAIERARGSVATVSVRDLQFVSPLFVYDLVSFYGHIDKIGKTSISVSLEVFAQRTRHPHPIATVVKVATATYIYVAIEKPGIKRNVPDVS